MNSIRPGKIWTTKLSSAGLIYCHFGEEVIKILLGKDNHHASSVIYDKVSVFKEPCSIAVRHVKALYRSWSRTAKPKLMLSSQKLAGKPFAITNNYLQLQTVTY